MIALLRAVLGVTLALALAPLAAAKVASESPSGFSLSYETEVPVAPQAAYDAFVKIGGWWDPAHSYSGDAKNLTIEVKPGGCWCETLPGGGFVTHMRVMQAFPGKQLMFGGGLGPLAFMGVTGSMSVSFEAKSKGTLVKLGYAVGGHNAKGFKELSAGVDGVLGGAFKRYANYASTGNP